MAHIIFTEMFLVRKCCPSVDNIRRFSQILRESIYAKQWLRGFPAARVRDDT